MSLGNFKEVQFRAKDETLRVVIMFEVDRVNTKTSPSGLTPNVLGQWLIRWEVLRNGHWLQLSETETVTLKEGQWGNYRQAEKKLFDKTSLELMAERHYKKTGNSIWGYKPPKEEDYNMAGKKFWTTITEGQASCNARFDDEEDARRDAERITQSTGKTVYVLEAISAVGLPQPKVEWSNSLVVADKPMPQEPAASYTPSN